MSTTKNEQHGMLSEHRGLFFALISSGVIIFVSSSIGGEANEITFSILATITTGAMVVFAVNIIRNTKSKYDALPAYTFAAFTILWFIGEQIWNYEGVILGIDQFPSVADAVWLAGYAVLFAFLLSIIRPFRENISRRILFASMALSISYFIPAAIMVINAEHTTTDLLVAIGYPIADVIVLIPLICAFVLFYGMRQNYLWAILISIIISIATDTGFLFLEINDAYYTGHPIWLGYIWSYILLAYGAYRQSLVMKNMSHSVIEQMNVEIRSHGSNSARIFVLTPLIISTAAIILAFSLIQIYDFRHMTTSEITVFQPIIYGSILSIVAITGIIFFIGAKMTSIRSKIAELNRTAECAALKPKVTDMSTSEQVQILEKRLIRIEQTGKKSTQAIIVLGIIVAVIVGYYLYTNNTEHHPDSDIPTAKFIVENIKGDTIDTWVTWNLSEGEPLHISIINADLVTKDKIEAIKSAILSEETLEMPNSKMGKEPEDLVATYYLGWRGALMQASKKYPTANIPTDIRVDVSDKPVGEIIIILSNLREADGTLGFTRSIADDKQNQILKSTVTIFDVKNLRDHEMSAIMRHEFGHAMGLGHATASEDLMYHKINTRYAYVSECDVDAIASLYHEKRSPAAVCKN